MNRLTGTLLAAVAAALLTAGAAWPKELITIDLVNEPASLDPHQQWNPDSYYVYRNIFDNLVTRDDAGEIKPEIATAWEQVSDTEMTMTLRNDVVFHDGEPLDADDVVYSIQRIIDPDFGSPQLGQFNKITSATKTGPHSVTITTDGPYPVLLAQLVKLSIVPQHVVEEVGNDAFNVSPVGSGPYKFEEWRRGVSVTLIRNEDYWGEKGPFDRAVFRAVPDASTRVADLRSGTADLVVGLDSDLAAQLESVDGVKVLSAPTERVGYLGINSSRPPFDTVEMRRALAMAIDREGIVEGILNGGEIVVGELASPAHFGWKDGVEPIPYDPEAARQIVAANPDAASAPVTFATGPVFDQRIVQAIQQMLTEVGFDVTINMSDMGTYLQTVRSPDVASRPTLNFGRWSCACQDADGIMFPLLHSSSSWSRVSDPQLDALLETARSSLDPKVRQDAYDQAHDIVKDKVYALPLYQAAALYGVAEALEWQPTANESMFLNRMSMSE